MGISCHRPIRARYARERLPISIIPFRHSGFRPIGIGGGGPTYNEIDGNATLWEEHPQIKFHQNRVRGPAFEPCFFRIEKLSCPEIVDDQGRQIQLPVLRRNSAQDAESKAENEASFAPALIKAMAANPKGTQKEWAVDRGRAASRVNGKLQKLRELKLVEPTLDGKWQLTPKGKREASQC